MDHAGPDRLPHAPGLWRQSRRGVRTTTLRRILSRCARGRRHPSDHARDCARRPRVAVRVGAGAPQCLMARGSGHRGSNQVMDCNWQPSAARSKWRERLGLEQPAGHPSSDISRLARLPLRARAQRQRQRLRGRGYSGPWLSGFGFRGTGGCGLQLLSADLSTPSVAGPSSFCGLQRAGLRWRVLHAGSIERHRRCAGCRAIGARRSGQIASESGPLQTARVPWRPRAPWRSRRPPPISPCGSTATTRTCCAAPVCRWRWPRTHLTRACHSAEHEHGRPQQVRLPGGAGARCSR